MIRDLYQESLRKDGEENLIPIQMVMKKCAARGISEDAVRQCIEEYSANDVLMVDKDKRIIFT